MDLNCNIEVSNNYGQTALFWIVTKIPDIVSFITWAMIQVEYSNIFLKACDALNMLQVSDNYARKDFYYLTYLQPHLTGTFPSFPTLISIIHIDLLFL
jgi:hypothetical protein